VVENYVDDFSKMALALTSAQMAKDEAIKEYGVGEELALHFLAWADDSIVAICQMDSKTTALPPEDKLKASSLLCAIMRKYWWCTALTMVSEGYCSLDSQATKNVDLSEAFLNPKLPVYECVTVSHASIDDEGLVTPVSMVAAPFTLKVGREVDWREILVYPEKADQHIKQTRYPKMIRKSLDETPVVEIDNKIMDEVRSEIFSLGFLMQEF
jgi:hypothetical protein